MVISPYLIHLMSSPLFGTSPENPRSSSNRQSDLFDDSFSSTKPTHGTGASSGDLFGEDDSAIGGGEDSSPWPLPVAGKKVKRGNAVKTLLPPGDVPESYIDTFDTLQTNGYIESDRITSLLGGTDLSQGELNQIREVVPVSAQGLDRNEFNVLLALVGLAQRKEEISLDSVDDHKRSKLSPRSPERIFVTSSMLTLVSRTTTTTLA